MVRKMLKRKVWIASLLCTALLATGCSAAGTQTESVSSGELSTESESESGPVTKSITVVSITGNQLTYRVNEEETDEASDKAESTDEKANNGEISEENPPGEMPSGENPPGEMPSGEMPSGFPGGKDNTSDASADTADGTSDGSTTSGRQRMEKQNGTDAGTFTGFSKGNRDGSMEVKTIYLPVNVKVITDTGKTKTYQILQAGDVLDVTFDTDSDGNEVITAITITGTSNS